MPEWVVTCSVTGNELSPAPASANRPPRPGWLPHLFQKQLRDRALDRQFSAPHTPAPAQHAPGSTAPLPGLCAAPLPFPPAPRWRAELPPPPASSSPRPPSPDVAQGHRGPSGTASCQAWCRVLSSRAECEHPGPEGTSVWGTRTNPLVLPGTPSHLSTGLRPCGQRGPQQRLFGAVWDSGLLRKRGGLLTAPLPPGVRFKEDPTSQDHTDLE